MNMIKNQYRIVSGFLARNSMARNLAALALVAVFMVSKAHALGTADPDVSSGVDNTAATFAYVKTTLIAIGVFLVGWSFFKRIKRA